MATHTTALSAQLEEFIADRMKTGQYSSPSEVIDAARSALLREEADEEAKMSSLTTMLDEADASGEFEGDAFESVRQKMGWSEL